jgi:phenylacetate-CoA ligase
MSRLENIVAESPAFVRDAFINAYGYWLRRQRFSREYQKFFTQVMENLTKTPDEIREEQLMLLKDNLIHANEKIPYYQDMFRTIGFHPSDLTSLSQLSALPVLTKDIIRENFDRLYNKSAPKHSYRLHATSGSTGQKLKFLLPKELMFAKNAAFTYRFYSLAGVMPMDRRVTIGGRMFTRKAPYWTHNRAENQLLLSAHHLSLRTVDRFLERIAQFSPVFIQGHPSAIFYMADHMARNGCRPPIGLKAIFTTGETLTEENRTVIQEAFAAPVYQQYGSGESCFSAQETPDRAGYALNYEHGLVELEGSGDLRDVIVTSFQNPVMPFIRYRIGDLVRPVKQAPQTSIPLPILFDQVIGRIDDCIYSPSGDMILPVTVRMGIKPMLKEFTNYQLVQMDRDTFELRLQDAEHRLNEFAMKAELTRILGSDARINVLRIDSVMSSGGKVRNVVNSIGKSM